jgi:hypothetical protein
MGVLVDLVEEVRDRLATAQSSGALTSIKAVRVCDLNEARNNSDFPFINIRLLSGAEEPAYQANGFIDTLQIEVKLLHSKLADLSTDNMLYKTGDSTGALFMLETILNVIDKDTLGSLSLNMNETSNVNPIYTWDIDDTNSQYYEVTILIQVPTVQFQGGLR